MTTDAATPTPRRRAPVSLTDIVLIGSVAGGVFTLASVLQRLQARIESLESRRSSPPSRRASRPRVVEELMDDADDVVLEANVPIRATMQKEKMVQKFGKGNDDTGVDDDNEADNVDLIEEVHELEDEDEEEVPTVHV